MTKDEELEDLRRWKRTIESLAGDKTEYVLATINADLRESNAELLAALEQEREAILEAIRYSRIGNPYNFEPCIEAINAAIAKATS